MLARAVLFQGGLVACEQHNSPLHAIDTCASQPCAAFVNVCTERPQPQEWR